MFSVRRRKVVQISAVDNTIYALCDDGTIWCWYKWDASDAKTYTCTTTYANCGSWITKDATCRKASAAKR